MSGQHAIDELVMDLSFSSARLTRHEQSELADWISNEFLPQLDKLFDIYSSGTQVLYFEQINLDLGWLPARHYRQEIVRQTCAQLEFLIAQASLQIASSPTNASLPLDQRQQNLEQLLTFLRSGQLPFHRDNALTAQTPNQTQRLHEQLLEQALDKNNLLALLRSLPQRQQLLTRLVTQFSSRHLAELLRQLAPEQFTAIQALLDLWELALAPVNQNRDPKVTTRYISAINPVSSSLPPLKFLWMEVLDVFLSHDYIQPSTHNWLLPVLMQLTQKQGLSLDRVAAHLLVHSQAQQSPTHQYLWKELELIAGKGRHPLVAVSLDSSTAGEADSYLDKSESAITQTPIPSAMKSTQEIPVTQVAGQISPEPPAKVASNLRNPGYPQQQGETDSALPNTAPVPKTPNILRDESRLTFAQWLKKFQKDHQQAPTQFISQDHSKFVIQDAVSQLSLSAPEQAMLLAFVERHSRTYGELIELIEVIASFANTSQVFNQPDIYSRLIDAVRHYSPGRPLDSAAINNLSMTHQSTTSQSTTNQSTTSQSTTNQSLATQWRELVKKLQQSNTVSAVPSETASLASQANFPTTTTNTNTNTTNAIAQNSQHQGTQLHTSDIRLLADTPLPEVASSTLSADNDQQNSSLSYLQAKNYLTSLWIKGDPSGLDFYWPILRARFPSLLQESVQHFLIQPEIRQLAMVNFPLPILVDILGLFAPMAQPGFSRLLDNTSQLYPIEITHATGISASIELWQRQLWEIVISCAINDKPDTPSALFDAVIRTYAELNNTDKDTLTEAWLATIEGRSIRPTSGEHTLTTEKNLEEETRALADLQSEAHPPNTIYSDTHLLGTTNPDADHTGTRNLEGMTTTLSVENSSEHATQNYQTYSSLLQTFLFTAESLQPLDKLLQHIEQLPVHQIAAIYFQDLARLPLEKIRALTNHDWTLVLTQLLNHYPAEFIQNPATDPRNLMPLLSAMTRSNTAHQDYHALFNALLRQDQEAINKLLTPMTIPGLISEPRSGLTSEVGINQRLDPSRLDNSLVQVQQSFPVSTPAPSLSLQLQNALLNRITTTNLAQVLKQIDGLSSSDINVLFSDLAVFVESLESDEVTEAHWELLVEQILAAQDKHQRLSRGTKELFIKWLTSDVDSATGSPISVSSSIDWLVVATQLAREAGGHSSFYKKLTLDLLNKDTQQLNQHLWELVNNTHLLDVPNEKSEQDFDIQNNHDEAQGAVAFDQHEEDEDLSTSLSFANADPVEQALTHPVHIESNLPADSSVANNLVANNLVTNSLLTKSLASDNVPASHLVTNDILIDDQHTDDPISNHLLAEKFAVSQPWLLELGKISATVLQGYLNAWKTSSSDKRQEHYQALLHAIKTQPPNSTMSLGHWELLLDYVLNTFPNPSWLADYLHQATPKTLSEGLPKYPINQKLTLAAQQNIVKSIATASSRPSTVYKALLEDLLSQRNTAFNKDTIRTPSLEKSTAPTSDSDRPTNRINSTRMSNQAMLDFCNQLKTGQVPWSALPNTVSALQDIIQTYIQHSGYVLPEHQMDLMAAVAQHVNSTPHKAQYYLAVLGYLLADKPLDLELILKELSDRNLNSGQPIHSRHSSPEVQPHTAQTAVIQSTEVPTSEVPISKVPTSEVPNAEEPTGGSPTTEKPASDMQLKRMPPAPLESQSHKGAITPASATTLDQTDIPAITNPVRIDSDSALVTIFEQLIQKQRSIDTLSLSHQDWSSLVELAIKNPTLVSPSFQQDLFQAIRQQLPKVSQPDAYYQAVLKTLLADDLLDLEYILKQLEKSVPASTDIRSHIATQSITAPAHSSNMQDKPALNRQPQPTHSEQASSLDERNKDHQGTTDVFQALPALSDKPGLGSVFNTETIYQQLRSGERQLLDSGFTPTQWRELMTHVLRQSTHIAADFRDELLGAIEIHANKAPRPSHFYRELTIALIDGKPLDLEAMSALPIINATPPETSALEDRQSPISENVLSTTLSARPAAETGANDGDAPNASDPENSSRELDLSNNLRPADYARGREENPERFRLLKNMLEQSAGLSNAQLIALQKLVQHILTGNSDSERTYWMPLLSQRSLVTRLIDYLPTHILHSLFKHLFPREYPALDAMIKLLSEVMVLLVQTHNSPALKRMKWEFIIEQLVSPITDITQEELFQQLGKRASLATNINEPQRLLSLLQRRIGLLKKPVPQTESSYQLVELAKNKLHDEAALENGIHLNNVGMVLTAPFMPRLFSMLKLTDQGKFIHFGAAERATHLLQYIVTGATETPEYEMLLNKVLCGISTSLPITSQFDITEEEKTIIEQLMQSIIQHWKILGSTSIAGLRQTFLQRQGWLSLEDNYWQLKVQPGTFDMLLDQLPWNISLIKHAWMDKPLHVNWR